MLKNILLGLLISCAPLSILAQEQWDESRIKHEILKLPKKTSVLYIAAHPDDENTRLITWLANEKRYRTAYLSLTRGDGGQNLIGNELGVLLGIIRTNELAQARLTDGGEQYFTRAFDFGYSKTPEETLSKWNRDSLLADMVYVIRKLQPDVIITRFAESGYKTHGHHTTSAILANEAFDLAADPKAFPEQLSEVSTWQVKRLFYNASTWWNANIKEDIGKNDSLFMVDVGTYNPLLGASYTEIAGRSRSMHKSQGFGASEPVGVQEEFLILRRGNLPPKTKNWYLNPFAGIEDEFENNDIKKQLNKVSQNIDNKNINVLLTELVKLHLSLSNAQKSSNAPHLSYKKRQIENILVQLSGLVLRIEAENDEYAEGSRLAAKFLILNRSNAAVRMVSVSSGQGTQLDAIQYFNTDTKYNQGIERDLKFKLAPGVITNIPWLQFGLNDAMFNSSWRDVAVLPGTFSQFNLKVTIEIAGLTIERTVPVTYTSVDPVKGELRQEILVKPQLEIEFGQTALLFANKNQNKTLDFTLKARTEYKGPFIIAPGDGFSYKRSMDREIKLFPNESLHKQIEINAANARGSSSIRFGGGQAIYRLTQIKYDHIGRFQYPQEPVLPLMLLNANLSTKKVAYIQGAGDEVDTYLKEAGINIQTLGLDLLTDTNKLNSYQVLIFGIRAFNTLEFSEENHKTLMNYISQGGNVIVQYNTNRRLKYENFGPFNLKIGRGRVTEENAVMQITDTSNRVFKVPNNLQTSLFINWVQERGLYFAESEGSEYKKLLKAADSGEPLEDGILLIAPYGKGTFMYCGLSFFRQLPAGVPSAYQLLINMIDYER